MPSASADSEDNARIQGLTTQGRHLSRDEYDEAAKLHAQFRAEVARDPEEDINTCLAADVAPAAPAVSHSDAPASRKNWEPMTYDPQEHRSAVKKSKSRASHSIVKGKFKEKKNKYKLRV
jgi:hypothetical protein